MLWDLQQDMSLRQTFCRTFKHFLQTRSLSKYFQQINASRKLSTSSTSNELIHIKNFKMGSF